MKSRFILFLRADVYYCEDTATGKQASLCARGHADGAPIATSGLRPNRVHSRTRL